MGVSILSLQTCKSGKRDMPVVITSMPVIQHMPYTLERFSID